MDRGPNVMRGRTPKKTPEVSFAGTSRNAKESAPANHSGPMSSPCRREGEAVQHPANRATLWLVPIPAPTRTAARVLQPYCYC